MRYTTMLNQVRGGTAGTGAHQNPDLRRVSAPSCP